MNYIIVKNGLYLTDYGMGWDSWLNIEERAKPYCKTEADLVAYAVGGTVVSQTTAVLS